MPLRFLAYPLIFVALLQIVPLWRRGARWYAAQIAALNLAVIGGLGALLPWTYAGGLLTGGWAVFGGFVVLPRLLAGLGERQRRRGHWHAAENCWRAAAVLVPGPLSRLCRGTARSLHCLGRRDQTGAEAELDRLLKLSPPAALRGTIHLWRLTMYVEQRQWERGVTFYESVADWGSAWASAQARLLAARLYAETGRMDLALRCLQFVVLSPAVARLEGELWALRIRLAAMAGDPATLEALLARRQHGRRGFPRFAAYWRGRCRLCRGEFGEALRQFARAHALTHPRDRLWYQAIHYHLVLAERGPAGPVPAVIPAETDVYRQQLHLLQEADAQSATWRGLMGWGRTAPVALGLFIALVAVYFFDLSLSPGREYRLLTLLANTPHTVYAHQWWRAFTALYLHGGFLHLAMNVLGLWMFGSAVERVWGWWRFLLLFLLGGAAGNVLSAAANRHELAIGASAGVFALLAAYGVILWRLRSPLYDSLRRRLLPMLGAMVAVDLLIGALEPQIDGLAHLGGFVAGLTLAALLVPRGRNHKVS